MSENRIACRLEYKDSYARLYSVVAFGHYVGIIAKLGSDGLWYRWGNGQTIGAGYRQRSKLTWKLAEENAADIRAAQDWLPFPSK